MIKFLRKILMIDFVSSLLRTKQNPHIRFAGFLEVYAILWLILSGLILLASIKQDNKEVVNWVYRLLWIGLGVGSFFFYTHVGKLLKTYTEEQAEKFKYLRFLNPVAPVIYFTTALMVVIIVLNLVMIIFWVLGAMLFLIGALVTFGILLFDDNYKFKNFVGIPQSFFEAEDYFLRNYMSLEAIIVFLILIYFIIPIGSSLMILWQHYVAKKTIS